MANLPISLSLPAVTALIWAVRDRLTITGLDPQERGVLVTTLGRLMAYASDQSPLGIAP
jgi:hypothetical protein